MSVFYYSEKYSKGKNAGNKARNDVEVILSRNYPKLTPYDVKLNNRIVRTLKVLRTTFSVSKEDIIIVQYPLPRGLNWLAEVLTKIRNIVFVIHDLYELRMSNFSGVEIRKLRKAYGIISHNEKMTKFLIKNGINKEKIVNLQIFDYLIDNKTLYDHSNDKDMICFAGNLAKSGFIYNISEKITNIGVNVYGINYDELKNAKLHYKGSFDSEVVYKKIKGKFGLIWDGDNTESCTGNFGKYMMYNNPHKISMYIAACMPIVIWSDAALADFVLENNIGYVINKIDDIFEIYENLTDDKYRIMSNNVKKIREDIINGRMLEKALSLIIKKSN